MKKTRDLLNKILASINNETSNYYNDEQLLNDLTKLKNLFNSAQTNELETNTIEGLLNIAINKIGKNDADNRVLITVINKYLADIEIKDWIAELDANTDLKPVLKRIPEHLENHPALDFYQRESLIEV